MSKQKALPDFAYWAKVSLWTIEQATALLIGEDPDAIIDSSGLAPACPPETRDRYQKMFRLLDSHIRHSGIAFSQPPTEIIECAIHTKVDPPSALVEAVRAQGRTLIEKRTAARDRSESEATAQSKALGERERKTLLRMIIGMAIGGYGYDPDAARSDTPRSIADDLSSLGIDISDQTVREKLKDACAFLPGDWKGRRGVKAN